MVNKVKGFSKRLLRIPYPNQKGGLFVKTKEMNCYKVIDVIKNGILIGFLFRLVCSLFPPSKEFAIWWFPYHLQLYCIIYGIPLAVFCILQYFCNNRIKSNDKQVTKFAVKTRILLSLLSSIVAVAILTWGQNVFSRQLEMIMYYISVFFTSPH